MFRWVLVLAIQEMAPAGSMLGLALGNFASWQQLRLPTIGARRVALALVVLAARVLVQVARREVAQGLASSVEVAAMASELMAASTVALLRGVLVLAPHLVPRPLRPP